MTSINRDSALVSTNYKASNVRLQKIAKNEVPVEIVKEQTFADNVKDVIPMRDIDKDLILNVNNINIISSVDPVITYTLDTLTTKYHLTQQDIHNFLKEQKDGKYIVNQTNIEICTGVKDVKTVEQMLNAMKTYGFLDNYVRGAFSFTQELTDKYFILKSENPKRYILNQQALKADFPGADIQTLGQLKQVITGNVSTSTVSSTSSSNEWYSEGYLMGSFGFSALQIAMFFVKNEEGKYKLNQDAINEFYGVEYKRDTLEKLDEFVETYSLGTNRRNKVAEFLAEALRNGDEKWGFDKLDPKPTETEIQSFYSQLIHLDNKGTLSFKDYENLIVKNLPVVKNHIQLERFNNMLSGNELDIDILNTELGKYINRYADLMKNELNSYGDYHGGYRCNFTSDFVESVVNFAVNDLGVIGYAPIVYNVKDVIIALKEKIEGITSCGAMVPYLSAPSLGKGYTYSQDALSGDITNWKHSENASLKYFAKMFDDFFQKTGLDLTERKQYLKKLGRDFYNKYLKYNDSDGTVIDEFGYINIAKVASSYNMSDIFTLLQKDVNRVGHLLQEEVDNATSVDLNFLFSDSVMPTSIDAIYIHKHLDEMLISKDPGTRRFAQLIKEAIVLSDSFPNGKKCASDYGVIQDQLDVIRHLIETINYNCGVVDNKAKLSLSTIKTLNSDNLLNKVQRAMNSQMFYNACVMNVDGVLGDFSQGDQNDCWFLSTLISLSSGETGKQLIADAIKWADDYSSITVYLGGKSITFTVEEIEGVLNNRKGRAFGDLDVIVLELAYERLCGELDGTPSFGQWVGAVGTLSPSKLFHKTKDTVGLFTSLTATYDDNASGLDAVWDVFAGSKAELDKSDVKKFLRRLFDAYINGQNFAATFGLFTSGDQTYTWKCVGGGRGKHSLSSSGHMFAITGITNNTITFVNPSNSSKTYTVTWEEFANIGIAAVSCSYF